MTRIVILTALGLERAAVRQFLKDVREAVHEYGTVYDIGRFEHLEVIVVETGPGNATAAAEVERAITAFRPVAVVFVGVAGGLKDVAIGDVVVATKVYGYESGKEAGTFRPRPEVASSSYELVQRARSLAGGQEWLELLPDKSASPPPKIWVAPIAAGQKVVASRRSQTAKLLRANYGDAVAVEMEGFGFLSAAWMSGRSALVVRGISDLVDGKANADAEGWQPRAAIAAAAVTFALLREVFKPSESWANAPPPINP
jgi:nucleoside phosphorylase